MGEVDWPATRAPRKMKLFLMGVLGESRAKSGTSLARLVLL